jgi:hypothetical protein
MFLRLFSSAPRSFIGSDFNGIGLSYANVVIGQDAIDKWRPVGDSNPCCRDENPVS